MKQKFRIFTFVEVNKNTFDSFIGIVKGTYSQIYGGKNIKSYALYKIKDDKIVDQISWYNENQLVALEEQNSLKAEEMIEEYNFKFN